MPNGNEPVRTLPDDAWEHHELYRRVRHAIAALPSYFDSETSIAGVQATDLHTLNTVLAATIEDQVVSTLNAMRSVWDPDEEYALYSFVRQPQTFPDVVLRRPANGDGDPPIIMGIELKGWYLLAKEGEPNFRFTVTASASNAQDLIVVVPWVLARVLSGRPIVLSPYLESAQYAAEYRNYWWQHVRQTNLNTDIDIPDNVQPYPTKTDEIHDRPIADSGRNFGRFARTGMMDDYLADMRSRALVGVRVEHWLSFFRAFSEGKSEDDTRQALARLVAKIHDTEQTDTPLGRIVSALEELLPEEG